MVVSPTLGRCICVGGAAVALAGCGGGVGGSGAGVPYRAPAKPATATTPQRSVAPATPAPGTRTSAPATPAAGTRTSASLTAALANRTIAPPAPAPPPGRGCSSAALASFATDARTSGAERVAVRRLIAALASHPAPGNCTSGVVTIPRKDRPADAATVRCLRAAGYVGLLAHLPASVLGAQAARAARSANRIISAHEHRGDTYCVAP